VAIRYKYRTPDNDKFIGSATATANSAVDKNYLAREEVYADDYNQTVANLKKQRERNTTNITNQVPPPSFPNDLPANVKKGDYLKEKQLRDLQNATKGLVRYTNDDKFSFTAFSNKVRAIHLEEIRQVVDDSLNHARCVGGCSSECGRACGNYCTTECFGNCGGQCDGGCGSSCVGGCYSVCSANSCANSCSGGCANSCGSGCAGSCTGKCTKVVNAD
jgi:hypothetical protein